MREILLRGYYGQGNWGDEILLRALVAILTANGIPHDRLSYWCGHDTSFTPAAIAHNSPRTLQGMAAWIRSGAIVFSGGIFYDHLPGFNTKRLRRIWLLAAASHALGKKVILLGVSIGPLVTAAGRRLTCKILRMSDGIWVRDGLSHQFCRAAGVHCRQTPDLVAAMLSDIQQRKPSESKNDILFIPCNTLTDDRHARILGALAKEARRYGLNIHLLPIHVSNDTDLAARLAQRLGLQLAEPLTPDPMDLFTRIRQAALVVSSRLHGGWAAYLAGRPFLQVDYHTKCRGFAETIRLPSECLIDPNADIIDLGAGFNHWFKGGQDLYNDLILRQALQEEALQALAEAAGCLQCKTGTRKGRH